MSRKGKWIDGDRVDDVDKYNKNEYNERDHDRLDECKDQIEVKAMKMNSSSQNQSKIFEDLNITKIISFKDKDFENEEITQEEIQEYFTQNYESELAKEFSDIKGDARLKKDQLMKIKKDIKKGIKRTEKDLENCNQKFEKNKEEIKEDLPNQSNLILLIF